MRWFLIAIISLSLGCKSSEEQLPILSYTINNSGDKEYYTISYEEGVFKNQLGQDFTTQNIQGKIVLANFFFTRCPSICPPMRNALIDIAKNVLETENFLLISHTIDPKSDTAEVLKAYAEATGVSNNQWQFLRASEEQTKAQAKQFMTNFRPNEDGTDFYHSSYVALVDEDQNIRGFYNVLVQDDLSRLKKDLNRFLN
ncbi:SCO family protein [Psychroserpens sp. XS_ASV72]|uniref:SCO family protein n=1 Tax=Psychroserpens sp. XS_ASV72 TaxID=3241293 RepID=UPI0035112DDD